MDGEKTYFNIAKLTEEFRRDLTADQQAGTEGYWKPKDLRIWEMMVGLAVAQQLSVISGTLSELVAAFKGAENVDH